MGDLLSGILNVLGAILMVGVAVLWLVVWLRALRDAYTRPESDWRAAGESRVTWLLLIFVFQFFGLAAYLWWIQPKLDAAAATRAR